MLVALADMIGQVDLSSFLMRMPVALYDAPSRAPRTSTFTFVESGGVGQKRFKLYKIYYVKQLQNACAT
jgi:hypothetical protein